MDMLDEGTTRRTGLQISDELATLGATLGSGCDLDMASVGLSTLSKNLDPALDLFADVILHPAFREGDFARLQKQSLAVIQREKAEPVGMALRVFPGLLFGKNHAYGNPLTGSGTTASVGQLTPADMRKFHQTWFKPDNATLIVVGDTTLAELQPKLEKLFQNWRPGAVPKKNLAVVPHQEKSSVYLIDRPGAQQSIIYAGHVAPPKANPDEIAIETVNHILGGSFTSRVNMNLREDKHWSYGAHTFLAGARGQRPFVGYAPVQTDKTRESMVELLKELRGVLGDRLITGEELAKAKTSQTLKLNGNWETAGRVAGTIAELVRFGLPENHYTTYPDRVLALKLDDLARAAKTVVHPDNLVWVVVGDRAKIEAGLRELNYGQLHLIDADGNPVTK